MKKQCLKIALAATFVLAMAFTLSCSKDDEAGGDKPIDESNVMGVRCEDIVFDTSAYSCFEGVIRTKCSGMLNCQENATRPARCNGILYNPLEASCLNSKIVCKNSSLNEKIVSIEGQIRKACSEYYPETLVDICVDKWIQKIKTDETLGIKPLYDRVSLNAASNDGKCVSSVNMRSINEAVEVIIDEGIPYCVEYLGDPNCPDIQKPSSSSRASSSSIAPSSSSIQTGIVYGPSVEYEGETYKTVVIGEQTWFQRNLNYNASGSVCYNNETANCAIYGRLYDWATANNVCPSGWHLPTDADWDKLMRYVDGSTGTSNLPTAGRYLKARSGWNSYEGQSGNGEDTFGFSALPGGSGYWWSASEYDSSYAYSRDMSYSYEGVGYNDYGKDFLFSVRCLQDYAD